MQDYLFLAIAIIMSLSVHELAHGLVSHALGDPTPKEEGRLTLNPLRHVDWMGVACMVLFRFGWAKPVPVNTRYYKDPKTGMIWTAFAGPMANFILSFVMIGIAGLLSLQSGAVIYWLVQLCIQVASVSTALGVFNLLPIPPMDGSKVFFGVLPDDQYFKWIQYNSPILMAVLFGLLYTDALTGPLYFIQSGILQTMLNFWGLIF